MSKRKEVESENQDAHNSHKSAKRRKNKKPKDINDEDLDISLGLNHVFGRLNSHSLSDHIAQRTARFQPSLTASELEDRRIPEDAIRDTTAWSEVRNLQKLPDFLEYFSTQSQDLRSAPKQKGSPHTLVVTSAGIRAADITRCMRRFQSDEAIIAKLFAKHIKLNEAIELVKKKRINIGVGTPQRIVELIEKKALSISSLRTVVIDASHIDQRQRGIMDMSETHIPLTRLLNISEIKTTYGEVMGGRRRRLPV